jgi:hypothetical protein
VSRHGCALARSIWPTARNRGLSRRRGCPFIAAAIPRANDPACASVAN